MQTLILVLIQYSLIYIKLYLIILLSINIIPCSATSISTCNYSTYNIYKVAQNKLYNSDYKGAIQDLKNLEKLYLFDPCPQQICLDLIYAHYKLYDLESANNYTKLFIKLYPNHKYYDYALYMHGIIAMCLDTNNKIFIKKYLNRNWFDRDPKYARTAFYSFAKLIREYPNSQYSADAYKRLIFLKNRIAEYELSIVKFYFKRNAHISVIARTEKMLYYFPDTHATLKALHYMQRSYRSIFLFEYADKIAKIIATNLTH